MAAVIKDSSQFRITRETRAQSSNKYDYVLYVNSDALKEVITSSEIEDRLEIGDAEIDNWDIIMTTFAEAYLDTENIDKSIDLVAQKHNL